MGNVALDTAVSTTAQLLPALLAAEGVVNPHLATAAQIAPLVINAMNAAAAFNKAGLMTDEALAAAFQALGQSVKTHHDEWVAMNAAEAEVKAE